MGKLSHLFCFVLLQDISLPRMFDVGWVSRGRIFSSCVITAAVREARYNYCSSWSMQPLWIFHIVSIPTFAAHQGGLLIVSSYCSGKLANDQDQRAQLSNRYGAWKAYIHLCIEDRAQAKARPRPLFRCQPAAFFLEIIYFDGVQQQYISNTRG